MSTPFAEVSIAGIDLESTGGDKCKAFILDGANFLTTTTGNTVFAADGSAYTQILTITGGRAFGILVKAIESANLTEVIEAVMAAVAGASSFNVKAKDDVHDIDEACIPDFAAGWLKYPEQKTHPNQFNDVTFRFQTVEDEES